MRLISGIYPVTVVYSAIRLKLAKTDKVWELISMSKVQVQGSLSEEIYQQLQVYMTDLGLEEAAAIEAIVSGYFDNSQDELMRRIAKIEQDLSQVKRHVLTIRFRPR